MKYTYRVKLKVGYYERWFDFNERRNATDFAELAVTSNVPNENNEKLEAVSIEVRPCEEE